MIMIWQDFKYAIRLLSKKPGFTALTTLVMATGIGLSVYMFTFFHTILFKDLDFKDGASLVMISGSVNGKQDGYKINALDYAEIMRSVKGLKEYGGYNNANVVVTATEGAIRFPAVLAQANIFQLTRTEPILGRSFRSEDEKIGSEKVVVIGFELWQSQFSGGNDVLKQSMRINGEKYNVVGVMPEGYMFPRNAQIWLPLQIDPRQLTRENSTALRGLAHLEDGASMAEVNRELSVVMKRIENQHPQTNTGVGAHVTSIPGVGGADGAPVIYTMHTVAVLILLLASINVGNLLLSRALERGKETAIRVALGAPRSRLISQMLWESTIICTLGGMIGFLVMAWGLEVTEPIVATFYADPLAFWWDFGIDSYSVTLFLIILISTIFVTGFLPAWRSTGNDFNAVLRDGTRGAQGKKAGRLNRVLVISEIFISMTVLIASAVMVQSAYEQTNRDMGAITENTLVASVLLPEANYDTDAKKAQFTKTLQSRLENSGAIETAMLATSLPGHYSATSKVIIEGKEYGKDSNNSYPSANDIAIMTGSLAKLGVELRQGRYFNNSDDGLEKSTALVSESFAKRHFPQQGAIGQRFRLAKTTKDTLQWVTIVGVVEHTIQGNRDGDAAIMPSIYRPLTQTPGKQLTIAMQLSANSNLAVQHLRKVLQGIDSELASYRIETYQASNDRITAPVVFISSLTAIFALAGVVLAASGIYGVMANTISQRTQEIGIKRALGADEERITKEFVFAGVKLLLWGGIPGILAGGFMGFAMAQMFGTSYSALIFMVIIMVSLVVATVLVATYLPTKNALRLEPSQALHYE
jgi:predicted permease